MNMLKDAISLFLHIDDDGLMKSIRGFCPASKNLVQIIKKFLKKLERGINCKLRATLFWQRRRIKDNLFVEGASLIMSN